ncbi:hypothetical protein VTL71DRAFT_2902 [Oculimacula yallundae]|uniref:Uncharacterized protein n=1 Tax=Oculimacula yallundae TaxID=86028 RepID=A0ABR4C5M0_9HELO
MAVVPVHSNAGDLVCIINGARTPLGEVIEQAIVKTVQSVHDSVAPVVFLRASPIATMCRWPPPIYTPDNKLLQMIQKALDLRCPCIRCGSSVPQPSVPRSYCAKNMTAYRLSRQRSERNNPPQGPVGQTSKPTRVDSNHRGPS